MGSKQKAKPVELGVCVISLCVNHGQEKYRLNIKPGPWGKRRRLYFDTKEAAEAEVEEFHANILQHGGSAAAVGPEETHALARWLLTFSLPELETLVQRAITQKQSRVMSVKDGVAAYL